MDTIVAGNILENGERFLGDRAAKEEEASLPGESMVSSRSITKNAAQPLSNLPPSTQLFDEDFSNTLPGLPDPQYSPPIGIESSSKSPTSPGNRMVDLPTAPEQRSTTPIARSNDEQPLSLNESRANSTTSIPLRFRNPNVSPGTPRNMSFSSPVAQSTGSPTDTPSRPRQQKSHSVDYRSTSALPLYLVERTRQIPPIEESLPSLPSSRTTSRSNSTYGSGDDEFESVREYPRSRSAGSSPMSVAMTMTSAPLSRTSSLFGQAETDNAELLGSQQATPKASTFPQGTMDLPEFFPDLDLNASGSDEVRSREIGGIEDNENSFASSHALPMDLSLAPVTVGPRIPGNDDPSSSFEIEPLNLEDLPKLPDSDPPSPTTPQDSRYWDNEDNRRESVITVIGGNAADELRENFREDDLEDKDEARTTDALETPFATPMMEPSENIQLSSETNLGDNDLNKEYPLAVEPEDTNLVPTVVEAVIPSATDTMHLVADAPRSADNEKDEIRETANNSGMMSLVTEIGPIIPLKESSNFDNEETSPRSQEVVDSESNEQALQAEDAPAPFLTRQASKKKAKKDKKDKKAKATRGMDESEPVASVDVPSSQDVHQGPETDTFEDSKIGESNQADDPNRTFEEVDVSVDIPTEVSALSKKQQKKKEKRKGRKGAALEDDTIYSEDVSRQASGMQEPVVTEEVKEEPIDSSMDFDRIGKEIAVQPLAQEEFSAGDNAIFFETKASKKKSKKGKKDKSPMIWDDAAENPTVEHIGRELPDTQQSSALEEIRDENIDSSIIPDVLGEDSSLQPVPPEQNSATDDKDMIFEFKPTKKSGKKAKKGKKDKDTISSYDDGEKVITADISEEIPNTQMPLTLERGMDELVESSEFPGTAENVNNVESATTPQTFEAGYIEFPAPKSSKKSQKKKGKSMVPWNAEEQAVSPSIDKPVEAENIKPTSAEPNITKDIVEEKEGRVEDFPPDTSQSLPEAAGDLPRPMSAKERKKAKKAKKGLSRVDIVANEASAVDNPDLEDVTAGEQMTDEDSAEPKPRTEIEAADNSQMENAFQEESATLRESAEITAADDYGTQDSIREGPLAVDELAEPFRSTENIVKANKEPLEIAKDTKDTVPENEDATGPESKEADSFEIFPVSRNKVKKGKKGKKSNRQASDSLEDSFFPTNDIILDDTRELPALDKEIANEETGVVQLEAVDDPLFSRKASRKKEKKAKKSKKGLSALDLGDDVGFKEEASASKNLTPVDAELMQAAAVSLPDADVAEEIDLAETGHDDDNIEPRSQDQSRSLPIVPLELTDINNLHNVSDFSNRENDILMQDAAAVPLPDEKLDVENDVAMIDQSPSMEKEVSSLLDNTMGERAIEEAIDTPLPEMAHTEKEELQEHYDFERDEIATPFDEEPRDLAKSLMEDSENFTSKPQNVPLPKVLDEFDKPNGEKSSGKRDIPLEEAIKPDPSYVSLPEGDDREIADLGSKRIDKYSNSILDDAAIVALPVASADELESPERSLHTKSSNLLSANEAKSSMLPESNLEEPHNLNEKSYADHPGDGLVEEAKNISLPTVGDEESQTLHNLSDHDYEDHIMEDARHIPLPDADGEEAAIMVQRSEDNLYDVAEQAKAISLPRADASEAVKLEDRFGGDRVDEVTENAKEIVLPDPDSDEAVALQEKALDHSDLGDDGRKIASSVWNTEETDVPHVPTDGVRERGLLDEAREISLPIADDEELSVLEEHNAIKDKGSLYENFPSVPKPSKGQDALDQSENFEVNNTTQLVDEAKSIPLPTSTPEETIVLADPQHATRSIPLEDAQAIPLPNANLDELEELTNKSLDQRTDDIQSSQTRDAKDAVELSDDTGLKFAATVAAGLQDSGFDPNIVIANPTFSRRSSPTNPSAALESEDISFAVKKGKKGKTGKKKNTEPPASSTRTTQDHEPADQGRAEDVVEIEPSASSNFGNDEFTADVLAGLRSSGFDPKVLEESNSTTRAEPEAELEEVFATKKSKKGKKGKKSKASIESKQIDRTEDLKISDASDQQDKDNIAGKQQDYLVNLDSTRSLLEAQKDTQDRSLLDESLNISKEIALPESPNGQVSADKNDKLDSDIAVNALSRTQSDEANEFIVTKKSKKNKKGKKKFQGLAAADIAEPPSVPISITDEKFNSESADQVKSVQDFAEVEPPPQPNLVTEDRKLEEVPASKSPLAQVTAPEPTWSFSSVRDSAVVVPDTPIVSQSVTAINTNRDSGYIGSPNGQEQDQNFNYQSLSAGVATVQSRNYGDGDRDAMKITVDDKDAPGNVETIEDKSEAQSKEVKEALTVTTNFSERDGDGDSRKAHIIISPVQLAEQTSSSPRDIDNTYNGKAPASPKSPTPTRDIAAENATSMGAISRSKGKKKKKKNKSTYSSDDKEVDDYFTQKPADEDSAPSVLQEEVDLRNLTATPSATLETIHERSSQISPVHKTARSISDVGSPDHGLKSARRTSTPKPNIGERVRYSPASAASSSTNNKRDIEKSQISTEDIRSHLSWPPVDEENETVELDRSFKVDPSRFTEAQHRSPSTTSNWSNGSAGKFKTPDFRRPTSAHSNASSTHSLRRTDRSISGDLRAASRLGDPIPRSVGRLSTSPLQESPLVRPPSYEPLKGRGERRTVVMAEIYVSLDILYDILCAPMLMRHCYYRKVLAIHATLLDHQHDHQASVSDKVYRLLTWKQD